MRKSLPVSAGVPGVSAPAAKNFDEFYAFYLSQHLHPMTRRVHVAGPRRELFHIEPRGRDDRHADGEVGGLPPAKARVERFGSARVGPCGRVSEPRGREDELRAFGLAQPELVADAHADVSRHAAAHSTVAAHAALREVTMAGEVDQGELERLASALRLAESALEPGAPCDTRRLRDVERRHVQDILRQEKGNKVQAARALGISRRALYRLIAKYHLEAPRPA